MPFDTPISAADASAQTSNFFRGLTQDKTLDPRVKAKMATQFFSNIEQIRKIRQQNELHPIRLAQEQTQLDAARFTLDRARKRAEEEEQVGTLAGELDDEITGILDDDQLAPEDRVAAIRRAGYEAHRRLPRGASQDATWIARKYAMAERAAAPVKPLGGLTPAQIGRAAQAGVPDDILDTGDPRLIGQAMDESLRMREAEKDQYEQNLKRTEQDERAYQSALSDITDIEFAESQDFDPKGNVIPDTSRFKKGDIVKARIKKALALSPDPELRKLSKSDDAKVLREAAMKAVSGPVRPAPRLQLPARP